MSNPLAAFRKHQNVLLAVFGVLIMLSFAVGPIIQGCQQRTTAGPQADATVVSYRAGSINESELNSLRYARQALRQYMATIGQIATERGATVGGSFVPPRIDEPSLVEVKLMADEARRMGIAIEQEEMVRFLKDYTGGKIKSAEFADLLADITGNRMSESQFFSAMEQHLLAARFGGLVQQGLAATTPTSMWDSYQRLNRRIEAEVVAYPVANYESSDAISETRLREIYEEGKERFIDPSSSRPAFKQRKRVAVAYVKCVRDEYVAAEKLGITEEDIAAHYEENKESFRNETLPPVGEMETSIESDLGIDVEGAGPESDAKILDDGDADESSDVEPTDDSACGPQEDDAGTATDEEQISDEAKDDGTTAGADAEESSETDDADAAPSEDTDGADSDVTDSQPDDQADGAESDAESSESDSTESELETTEDDIANLPDEPAAPEFKPLDEVRDSIIETIASKRAEPKFEQAKNLVESEMRNYFNDYTAWTVGADEEGSEQPPVTDLAVLAAKHKFTAGSVPLVNGFELTEKDPVTGESKYDISASFDIIPPNIVYFSQVVFDERLRKFEARRIRGADFGSDYIYWKTDETEPITPEFEDCKKDVEAFVRRSDASQKAREAVQQEATAIASTGKSLTDHFVGKPNVKVIETGVFSWMTMLTQQQRPVPVLSEVPGVPHSRNDEFMRDVFSLKEGEYGVALNGPKTIAYLVHVKADVEPLETLRSLFAKTGPTFDTLAVQRNEQMNRLGGWYNDFLETQQLKWLRQPRQ